MSPRPWPIPRRKSTVLGEMPPSASNCIGLTDEWNGVRQGLTNVLFFKLGQVGHDLRGRHAVRYQVDDMGDGDTQAANGGSTRQDVRIHGDAIERVRHRRLSGISNARGLTLMLSAPP